jgi:hypothetical protein
MHGTVVSGLDPGAEQPVQLRQVPRAGTVADLDEELVADGAEEPFDLAPALGLSG